MFETFEEVPLGSASVAQVHRETLRDSRQVAVKVQLPGIIEGSHADLDALAGIAAKADCWTDAGRRARFGDRAFEFRKSLLSELDYRSEAENLERFSSHFEDYPELCGPLSVWNLTRKRVLTMTLVRGVKVTEISGLRRTKQEMSPLATAVMRGYLDYLFMHSEIYADPHPSNLLVTADERIGLLDPEIDVKQIVEDHLEKSMQQRLKRAISPARLASEAMELQALVREAPAKLSDILSLAADNRLQVRLAGLEDSPLVANLKKIASRISTGIITASLILASALLMRLQGGPWLFGYPALAAVLLTVAATLGLAMVISALLRDRKAKPREVSGPR